LVLTQQGAMLASSLSPGSQLWPGCAKHAARVQAVQVMAPSLRQMVTLHFGRDADEDVAVTVTPSHTLMVKRGSSFQPMQATEALIGDVMRTVDSRDYKVAYIEHTVMQVGVVEVLLADNKGSFFTGMPGMAPKDFLEVFGALTPLGEPVVELLCFQRFDRFQSIINENVELKSCREDLEEAGYSTDLGLYGLGAGKLLVHARLAERAIEALKRLASAENYKFRATDVVVSRELKAIVLEQVERLAPRNNPIRRCQPLALFSIRTARTFLEFHSGASISSGAVTHSSTDAHLGTQSNPRLRGR